MIFIVVLSALFQACTSVDVDHTNPEETAFNVKYGLYSYDLQKMNGDNDIHDLEIIFPAVPGGIFGNSTDDILSVVSVENSDSFNFSVPNKLSRQSRKI